jgi:hypothetical protein
VTNCELATESGSFPRDGQSGGNLRHAQFTFDLGLDWRRGSFLFVTCIENSEWRAGASPSGSSQEITARHEEL